MTQSPAPGERLLSLDFFRGFTMFLLIVEFTQLFQILATGSEEGSVIHFIAEQFHHHPWAGLHFWDLIQPFFMFIVGVAMPFSYAKRRERGASHREIRRHILLRCLILLLLGWWLYCQGPGHIVFRFQCVLAQLSVTILLAFFVMRRSAGFQLSFSLGLILLMELVYRFFWVEGFNQPFSPDQNFGAWFDLLISGELSDGHWVSVNAVSTTAHTIWGVMTGQLLMSKRSALRKIGIMVFAGLLLLAAGYGLSPLTPIIKRIATSSFVLVSGGWALLAMALSYYLIDVLKWQRGVKFFAIIGMNPLFIYLFAHVGGASLVSSLIRPFPASLLGFAGPFWVGFITALASSLALWGICYWLYRNKLFIRI